MYLYDTPRDTMDKDSMFHRLCLTSTWKAPGLMPNTSNYLFMCSRDSHSIQRYVLMCFRFSLSTQIMNHSSALELLAQHNHQSLKCSRASRLTQIINHSSAPELPTQHKSSITQVLESSSLNTNHQSLNFSRASRSTQNISSIMCFRIQAQHKQAYISSSIIGLRTIYKTNHHVHMQWSL